MAYWSCLGLKFSLRIAHRTSTNVTEPGAVATGCYAQSIKSILRRTLNAGIRSLPLPVPYVSGINQLNSSSVLQLRTLPFDGRVAYEQL